MMTAFKGLFLAGSILTTSLLFAAPWNIDKPHSGVSFSAKHMMVSTVYGRFTDFDAVIDLDQIPPSQLSIEATIKTTSVDTDNEKRDADLRSENFFDAANHPDITFKSKRFEKVSDGKYIVYGDLTMRGITKEIPLEVEGLNVLLKDPWGNDRTGATATATINRTEWGLKWNKALEAGGVMVSEDIKLTIDVELMRPAVQEASGK